MEKNFRHRNLCCSIRNEENTYYNTQIINVAGCSLTQLVTVYSTFIQPFSAKLTGVLGRNYPVGSGNMVIVGVPWGFESMCKVLFSFMDRAVSEKILVSRGMDNIKKFVDKDQLPAHLGGGIPDAQCLDLEGEHLPWNDPDVLSLVDRAGFEEFWAAYERDELKQFIAQIRGGARSAASPGTSGRTTTGTTPTSTAAGVVGRGVSTASFLTAFEKGDQRVDKLGGKWVPNGLVWCTSRRLQNPALRPKYTTH